MNKFILPLLVTLLFASSCSKDAQKALNSSTPLGDGQLQRDQVILTTKLGDFCDGQECPAGIVAVKTDDKSKTCAGISKSTTEVLVSQNCLGEETQLNIQTRDGKLIKVESIEEELTNEFEDKVFKLNLKEELASTSNISTPDSENNDVKLFHFNELGELKSQDCKLTYASLAYSNSFDNESQLLNIKECDGISEGALISQDGNSVGFLTKKHSEIELFEGVSINGVVTKYTIFEKIDSYSYKLTSDESLIIANQAVSYPLYVTDGYEENINFNPDTFTFSKIKKCYKPSFYEVLKNSSIQIIFNNDLQEFTDMTSIKFDIEFTYVPTSKFFQLHTSQKIPNTNYIKVPGSIDKLELHKVKSPFGIGQTITKGYIYDVKQGHTGHNLKLCNSK